MKKYLVLLKKHRRLVSAFLSAFFLVLLVGFSLLVKDDITNTIDFDVTVRLRDNIPARLDPLFGYFSFFASFEVLLIALILLLLFQRKVWGLFVLFLFFLGHLFVYLGKMAIFHPPPPYMFYRRDVSFLFPSQYVQEGSSYPSGHSMRVTFFVILLLFIVWMSRRFSRNVNILITVLAVGFMFGVYTSKVLLGAHWSTDVVGGILIGISTAFASFILL